MSEETKTVTREQLRRAIVAGWTDCIPRFHVDLDTIWDQLDKEVSDDTKADGLYALDSFECWGDEVGQDTLP